MDRPLARRRQRHRREDSGTSPNSPLNGDVFINYRESDSRSYGALLYLALVHRFGSARVFLDSESIPAGADYAAELLSRVRRARVLLAVIGPYWLSCAGASGGRRLDDPDDWVRRELATAFDAGVRVIPVLTDEATLPSEQELPTDIAALSRCQYRRLRPRDAVADLARLVADIAPATLLLPSATATCEANALPF